MLADNPIDVVLLAPDLGASREFWADGVGLAVLSEDESSMVLGCRGDSRIILSARSTGTADEQTQASWRVDDLAGELAELRSRGVEVTEYDMPGLKTEGGIAEVAGSKGGWFKDPDGNILAVFEPPPA